MKSKIYTTAEAASSTETVFIVQFDLDCKNGAKVKTDFFSFQNNPKDLDPSYKTDLDL